MAAKPIERFARKQITEQGGWPRILARIASGETILAISRTIFRPDGKCIDRSTLSNMLHRWCRLEPANQDALVAARLESGAAHAERGLQFVEDAPADRDMIQKARVLADAQFRYAGFMDRQQFGESKGVNVTINAANLHIDALRQRSIDAGDARKSSGGQDEVNGVGAGETQEFARSEGVSQIAAPTTDTAVTGSDS